MRKAFETKIHFRAHRSSFHLVLDSLEAGSEKAGAFRMFRMSSVFCEMEKPNKSKVLEIVEKVEIELTIPVSLSWWSVFSQRTLDFDHLFEFGSVFSSFDHLSSLLFGVIFNRSFSFAAQLLPLRLDSTADQLGM